MLPLLMLLVEVKFRVFRKKGQNDDRWQNEHPRLRRLAISKGRWQEFFGKRVRKCFWATPSPWNPFPIADKGQFPPLKELIFPLGNQKQTVAILIRDELSAGIDLKLLPWTAEEAGWELILERTTVLRWQYKHPPKAVKMLVNLETLGWRFG